MCCVNKLLIVIMYYYFNKLIELFIENYHHLSGSSCLLAATPISRKIINLLSVPIDVPSLDILYK